MMSGRVVARTGAGLRRAAAAVAALALALLAPAPAAAAAAASLTLVCLPIGAMLAHCEEAAADWAAATGNEVRVVAAEGGGREPLEHYEDLFSVESPRIDVLAFPSKWVPALADDLIDLGGRQAIARGAMLAAAVRLGRSGGRQVGAPQHLALGLLFYRADLVDAPPVTWAELREAARRVSESGAGAGAEGPMRGLVFPSVPAGDLVAAALEWIASFGGAPLVDSLDRVAVDSAPARAALALADGWIGAVVAPEVVDLDRDQALRLFLEGRAMFLRHWSSVYPAVRAARGAGGEGDPVPGAAFVGTRLPRADVEGGRHPAALEVWYLGVSRHSRQPDAATALLAHLVGRESQKRAAARHGIAPTVTALYADPEVLNAQPWLAEVAGALDSAIVSPVRAFDEGWLEAVDAAAATLAQMLTSGLGADDAAASLDRALTRIQRGVFD